MRIARPGLQKMLAFGPALLVGVRASSSGKRYLGNDLDLYFGIASLLGFTVSPRIAPPHANREIRANILSPPGSNKQSLETSMEGCLRSSPTLYFRLTEAETNVKNKIRT
jgi:hypothetical protein